MSVRKQVWIAVDLSVLLTVFVLRTFASTVHSKSEVWTYAYESGTRDAGAASYWNHWNKTHRSRRSQRSMDADRRGR